MALHYNKVDPKELTAFQLIKEGEGKFKVVKVEEKRSRAGNDMTVVTFRLVDAVGRDTLHNEYLVSSDDEVQNKGTCTKIYNLLSAMGRTEFYGLPLEEKHILGGTGKCIIKTKKSEDPQYPDKSVISKYISVEHAEPEQDYGDMDQEIPF